MDLRTICIAGTVATALSTAGTAAANTNFDVRVNLDDAGIAGYFMSSFIPGDAGIGPTGSGNLNPTMNLRMGTRYRYNYTNAGSHPFELIAKGANSGGDTVLLSFLGGTGPLESDPQIEWTESGPDFYFTLTGNLVEQMRQGGRIPGYHCNFHPDDMRGNITTSPATSNLAWPSGAESFENALVSESISSAIVGWSIVPPGGVPGQYSALIANTPSGHTNQAPGSTRWLTITDTEDNVTASGRVYSNTITSPVTVGKYTFAMRLNIQAVGSSTPLIIAQHHDLSSAFQNVAGLEVTSTGVNAVVLGQTDASAIGKTGVTARQNLYSYGDTGGFAQNSWVTVEFELDFPLSVLRTRATGSDGSTQRTADVGGLDFPNGNRGVLRLCIRGNGTGNTSTMSIDNVSFSGDEESASARDWPLYE